MSVLLQVLGLSTEMQKIYTLIKSTYYKLHGVCSWFLIISILTTDTSAGTLRTSPSAGILPRVDDRSSEGPTICNGLFGQHHHIQLYPRRTLRTHQDSLRETL